MIPSSVIEKVRRFDAALRLREMQGPDPQKAGETCTMIALERRRRDGVFERIGWVRPDLLGDGTVLLNKLNRNDVRQYGSGQKAAQAYDESEQDAEQKRKAKRQDEFIEVGKTAHDHAMRRMGTRINNAGMPGVSA